MSIQAHHAVHTSQPSLLERVYDLPFAIFHDGAITRVGAWLLNEIGLNDDVHAETAGESQLHVTMPACHLALTCPQKRDRVFGEIDHVVERACEKDDNYKSINKIDTGYLI